jgi:hypothetical protein
VCAEENVDTVETVDAVSGGQDPLLVEEGAATEECVGALVHEDAGHPGVLMWRGLRASSDTRSGSGNTAFAYKKVMNGFSTNDVMIGS